MISSEICEAVFIPLPEGVQRELLIHNQKYTLTRMHLSKGVESAPHRHPHAQIVYLLSGQCIFEIDGRGTELKAGDYVSIESEKLHAFHAPEEDIVFLEFFVPGREDIAQSRRIG